MKQNEPKESLCEDKERRRREFCAMDFGDGR